MSRFIIYVFGFLLVINLAAQRNDTGRTTVLQDVIIYEDLLKKAEIGLTALRFDSLQLSQMAGMNLSDLLRNTASGQIRSYGSNGLSTPSFRGTGASHTAVLWNGINLQSPLAGVHDLSLVPARLSNEVVLQKGGTSSLYGNGAIGGSIQLNNITQFNKGFEASVSTRIGSFGNYFNSLNAKWSNSKHASSSDVYHRFIRNDFDYRNNYRNPVTNEQRFNASAAQYGFLQQNDWLINNHNTIGFKIWYQNNEIEVPNSIISADNDEANQTDEFVRALFLWNHDKRNYSFKYKQAIIKHDNHYESLLDEGSSNDYINWVNRIETNFDVKNHELILGINHSYDRGMADAFGDQLHHRNSTAFFGALKSSWFAEKLLSVVNLRNEILNFNRSFLSPSIGFDYNVYGNFWLQGNVSQNYRIPTFNEQFWVSDGALGNQNLKTETSNNIEMGLKHSTTNSGVFTINSSMTAYRYLIDNWIQWQPMNETLWKPINLKKVKSQGIEVLISGDMNSDLINIGFDVAYNWAKSTNQEVYSNNNAQLQKQLIYTPAHEGSINLRLSTKQSTLTINQIYTGRQYTEEENKDRFIIDDYYLTNIIYNHQLFIHKTRLSLQLEANNLFDFSYENRRGYPMYGRNYAIGLNLHFHKNH